VSPGIAVRARRVERGSGRAPAGIDRKRRGDAATPRHVSRTGVRNPCIKRARELAHQQLSGVQSLDGSVEFTAAVQIDRGFHGQVRLWL
jgi:hypothetical protein